MKVHKHIARHTKRYAGHFTKYLFERDTIFATLSVFVFLVLLGLIPINFYVLNPMKLALKDFDFNDIAYAKLDKKAKTFENRIVIVNIGHADREAIAYVIEKVSNMQPKVMGLDAFFEGEKDSAKDSILRSVFQKTKNLVVVSRLVYEKKKDNINIIPDYFDSAYSFRGFGNFAAEEIGTVRYYFPFETVNHRKYPHFTTAIVKEFDSNAYHKLEKRHKPYESINYERRVNQYLVKDLESLMMEEVDTGFFKNKIVLFGYVNPDRDDIEDKKFTPMNPKFAGKAIPDMNGVVVQANIISMVLDGNYVKKMPKWFAWVVAILVGWLHMSLFIRYYLENHIWFHLVAKLAQVFSAIFFAYLGIFIYDQFHIKLDMKYTLYVIVLAVDVIYFYEALAVWLHKKIGFKTVFHHHDHH
jgi:CHASE2 domain-containing sensor protein